MQCPSCPDGQIKEKPSTYSYVECGLKGVTLHGAILGKCTNCTEETIGIPAMSGLHTAIAKSLLLQPEYLQIEQLVFLHKHLNGGRVRGRSSSTQWRGYPLPTFDSSNYVSVPSPAAEIVLRCRFARSLAMTMGIKETFDLGRSIEKIKFQEKPPSPISASLKKSFLGTKKWVIDGH